MATQKEKSDIADLQRDVAVIKNDISYIKKGSDNITTILGGFDYASNDRVDDIEVRVAALEKYNFDNRIGTVFAGLLSNKVFTYFVSILIAAAVYYAVKTGGP